MGELEMYVFDYNFYVAALERCRSAGAEAAEAGSGSGEAAREEL